MAEGNGGYSQKVLTGVTIAAFAAMLGFFGWLASLVLDVRDRTTRIESDVKSLLRTRVVAEEKDTAQTERRLDQLEDSARLRAD